MDASAGSGMIAIPPGQVTLSDRRTQRSLPVELAPYQLAAFPITQARYAQVTGQRPSTAHGDQLPVESVSWWDAVRFCNALSQREGLAPAYRVLADLEGLKRDPPPTGTGSRPRPSGSTPVVPVPPKRGTGRSMRSPGIAATRRADA